jgi:ROK family protein
MLVRLGSAADAATLAAAPPAIRPSETVESRSAVLDAVRLGQARSRLEIAQATGLTRAVVAQRVGELIDRGLLSEGGTGPSTGGRPARRLRFEHGSGMALVADLGATSIDVALTDLGGTIVAHHDEPADVAAGPEIILGRVEALFDELLVAAGSAAPVWGIGIGVPGPVEFETGRPIAPPIMPGWDGYPVRERFAARFNVPVWVDNDVNVMALGEWRHGVARGHADVVFVKLGTGIGAGLISDGQLHRGAQGSAGDVGHIQVSDDPSTVCRCGNIGCLEALTGGAALARDARGTRRPQPAARGDPRWGRQRRCGRCGDRSRARRPGLGRAAPTRGTADRQHARGRRELLQPVAHRDRRGGRPGR